MAREDLFFPVETKDIRKLKQLVLTRQPKVVPPPDDPVVPTDTSSTDEGGLFQRVVSRTASQVTSRLGQFGEFLEEDTEGPLGNLARFALPGLGEALKGFDIGGEFILRGAQKIDPISNVAEILDAEGQVRQFREERGFGQESPFAPSEELLESFRERPPGEQLVGGGALDIILTGGAKAGLRGIKLLTELGKKPVSATAKQLRSIAGGQEIVNKEDELGRQISNVAVDTIVNAKSPAVELTTNDKLRNITTSIINRIGGPEHAPRAGNVQGIMDEYADMNQYVDSWGNIIEATTASRIKKLNDSGLKMDKDGRIASLIGIDASLPAAPTIVDVGARLPLFLEKLTDEQVRLIRSLGEIGTEVRRMSDSLGVEQGYRADVMDGGVYITRLEAVEGEGLVVIRAGGRGRGQVSSQQGANQASQTAGIEAGYRYPGVAEALGEYVKLNGRQAVNLKVRNWFNQLRDAEGELLSLTPKQIVLKENPEIAKAFEAIKGRIARVDKLGLRMSAEEDKIIFRFLNDPDTLDVDEFEAVFQRIVRSGPSRGKNRLGVKNELRALRADFGKFKQPYKDALERARVGRDRGTIDFPGLQERRFPLELANSANEVLSSLKINPPGFLKALNAMNRMYRGFNATADNSAIMIQALMGFGADPKSIRHVIKANILAWGKPTVLGKFIDDFDEVARARKLLTAEEWASVGSHTGGQTNSFMLGEKLSFGQRKTLASKLANTPGIKQANRAFGVTGDVHRLVLNQHELIRQMKSTKKTSQELLQDGTARKIAENSNMATGWSRTGTFGSLGELLLFAPRFFQARLEILGRAVVGVLPGASFKNRLAARTYLKFLMSVVVLTESINFALGNETDRRPIVDGKRNPNFYMIRYADRDWSLLGTHGSIVNMIVSIGTGDVSQPFRGVASGLISVLWTQISGKDYLGRPVRTAKERALNLADIFTPSASEEIPTIIKKTIKGVEEEQISEIGDAGTLLVGEFLGAKSSPLSFADLKDEGAAKLWASGTFESSNPTLYNSLQKSLKRQGKTVPKWEDLPIEFRDDVEAMPALEQRFDEIEKRNESFEGDVPTLLNRYREVMDEAEASFVTRMSIQPIRIDLRNAVKNLTRDKFTASEHFIDAPEVRKFFEKNSSARETLATVRELYYAVPLEEDELTGQPDFDTQQKLRDKVLAMAEVAGFDASLVTDRGQILRNPELSPYGEFILQKWHTDQKFMRESGYWDIEKDIVRHLRESKQGALKPKELKLWLKYASSTPGQREQLRRENPLYNAVGEFVSFKRKEMRAGNFKLEKITLFWQYTTSPVSKEGQAYQIELDAHASSKSK